MFERVAKRGIRLAKQRGDIETVREIEEAMQFSLSIDDKNAVIKGQISDIQQNTNVIDFSELPE